MKRLISIALLAATLVLLLLSMHDDRSEMSMGESYAAPQEPQCCPATGATVNDTISGCWCSGSASSLTIRDIRTWSNRQ